jgi:hypothetical protein
MGSGLLTGANRSTLKDGALHSVLKSSRILAVPCCRNGWLYRTEISNVTSTNTVWFNGGASFDAGCYLVRSCFGAWNFGGTDPTSAWVVNRAPTGFESPPGSEGHFVTVLYDDGASSATNNEAVPGSTGYSSEKEAERAACSTYVSFQHAGGKIGVKFEEFYYPDNTLGTRNPTYALYRRYPECPELVSVYCNYSGDGLYTVTVGIKNNSPICPLSADFTLSADEAVSVSPAPLSDTIGVGATKYLEFEWEADPVGAVEFNNVEIALARGDGVTCAALATSCAPILNCVSSGRVGGDIFCSGLRRWAPHFSIKNNGNSDTVNLVATVTSVSGAELITGWADCTVLESVEITFGQIATTNTVGKGFYFKTSESVAVFNVTLADGSTVFPGFTLTFNV